MSGLDQIKKFADQVKGVAGIGDEAVEAGKAIGQKRSMIDSLFPAPQSQPSPTPPAPVGTQKQGPIRLVPGEKRISPSDIEEWRKPLGSGFQLVR